MTLRKRFGQLATLLALALTAVLLVTACTAAPAATDFGRTIKDIQQRGELRVAITNTEPSNFKDPTTGQWKGIEFEIAKYIADNMKVTLVPVETTFANVVAEIQSGRADIAMPGLWATPARSLALTFSEPYRIDGIAMMYRADETTKYKKIEDFNSPNVTIAVAVGSTSVDEAAKNFPTAKTLQSNEVGRIQEVLAKRADAVILSYDTAKRYAAANSWAAVFPADRPFTGANLVVGMRYGALDLKGYVDATLAFMRTQGEMDKVLNKYLAK